MPPDQRKALWEHRENLPMYESESLFITAVRDREPELVKVLMHLGAHKSCGSDEAFAIGYAAFMGDPALCRLLIKEGISANCRDIEMGENPLHELARNLIHTEHMRTCLEILISNGADINGISKQGKTPLDIALRHQQQPTIELLCEYGAIRGTH